MAFVREVTFGLFCSALVAGSLPGCGGKAASPSTEDTTGGTGNFNDGVGPSYSGGGGTGYWWTYTDHNPDGSQYHATISQVTSLTVALEPALDDAVHGNVYRISGTVPPELPWVDVSSQQSYTIDPYWLKYYPDSRIPDYPAAGLGFCFQPHCAPFDATVGAEFAGIAFDLKLNVPSTTIWVSMPIVGTDLPAPAYQDAFPKACTYYTTDNPPAYGYQTCFADYRKGFYDAVTATTSYNQLAIAGTWKRYCVLYSEVGVPSWANAGTRQNVPVFDPTQLLKVRWDMTQPRAGNVVAPYDISLDNVRLITRDEAADAANNCDPSMINAPPGTGNQG